MHNVDSIHPDAGRSVLENEGIETKSNIMSGLKTALSKLLRASLIAHSHCSGWACTAFVRTVQAEHFSSQTGSRWILKMDSSLSLF